METKAIAKTKPGWPALFESGRWLDKFFNSPLDEYFNFGRILNVPSVNVNERDDAYALSIATPGLEKNDIHVQIEDGMLTVSAEKEEKEEKNGKVNRREYNYSSWSRSFTLPEDVDQTKIKAEYKNGELKIDVPRSAKKTNSNVKNIAVN